MSRFRSACLSCGTSTKAQFPFFKGFPWIVVCLSCQSRRRRFHCIKKSQAASQFKIKADELEVLPFKWSRSPNGYYARYSKEWHLDSVAELAKQKFFSGQDEIFALLPAAQAAKIEAAFSSVYDHSDQNVYLTSLMRQLIKSKRPTAKQVTHFLESYAMSMSLDDDLSNVAAATGCAHLLLVTGDMLKSCRTFDGETMTERDAILSGKSNVLALLQRGAVRYRFINMDGTISAELNSQGLNRLIPKARAMLDIPHSLATFPAIWRKALASDIMYMAQFVTAVQAADRFERIPALVYARLEVTSQQELAPLVSASLSQLQANQSWHQVIASDNSQMDVFIAQCRARYQIERQRSRIICQIANVIKARDIKNQGSARISTLLNGTHPSRPEETWLEALDANQTTVDDFINALPPTPLPSVSCPHHPGMHCSFKCCKSCCPRTGCRQHH